MTQEEYNRQLINMIQNSKNVAFVIEVKDDYMDMGFDPKFYSQLKSFKYFFAEPKPPIPGYSEPLFVLRSPAFAIMGDDPWRATAYSIQILYKYKFTVEQFKEIIGPIQKEFDF